MDVIEKKFYFSLVYFQATFFCMQMIWPQATLQKMQYMEYFYIGVGEKGKFAENGPTLLTTLSQVWNFRRKRML